MGKHNIIKEGDIFETAYGKCRVTNYENNSKVEVVFLLTDFVKVTRSGHLRDGNVKDPYYPKVYGVGYFGEGNYTGNSKLYALWSSMLERCYSPRSLIKFPTYLKCSVVKRWHNFQNFCEDITKMENWNTPGFELDKDLRVLGNKKYGPKYCSFVPHEINGLRLTEVLDFSKENGKFKVSIRKNGNRLYLGSFTSKKKARTIYLREKAAYADELAKKHIKNIHSDVYKTLRKFGV